MFTGHTQMFGVPHVARGPDVAQACSRIQILVTLRKRPRPTCKKTVVKQNFQVGLTNAISPLTDFEAEFESENSDRDRVHRSLPDNDHVQQPPPDAETDPDSKSEEVKSNSTLSNWINQVSIGIHGFDFVNLLARSKAFHVYYPNSFFLIEM